MLLENHYQCRYACAEEDVGRQTDDRVYVIFFYEFSSDLTLAAVIRGATEKYSVWQDDGHNTVRVKMVELVKQKGIVGLRFRCDAIVLETSVHRRVLRIPVLRIWWVADDRIHAERLKASALRICHWPVFIQRISATSLDVAWLDASHHEVHTGKIVRVLLEFLGIIFHVVCVRHMLPDRLPDGDQERSRTAGRVIDLDVVLVLMMLGDYFRHHHCHFVWGVELSCFLAGTGREIGDKVFVNVTKNIVVLFPICRNVLYKLNEVS